MVSKYVRLLFTITSLLLSVIIYLCISTIVTFNSCEEEKFSSAEAKVELELQELGKEFSGIPDRMSSSKASDMEQDMSLGSVESEKGASNNPTSSPFPSPPTFVLGCQLSIFV